jgi:L-lactate dehydrogenase complex protein LldG
MSSARDDILGTIRRSLGVRGDERTRRAIVEERIERAPRGVIPARGQVEGRERVALFVAQAHAAQATISRVADASQVPAAVAEYLRSHNLPADLRMGGDPRLEGMPWAETSLEIRKGISDGKDLTGLSHAFGGVAETGTLVLVSGPENPSTLNFLPDNHVVVVRAEDLEGDYEEVWSRIRFAYGKGEMPRTVNYVTGPSRSADIEQTLLLGAHGPRRLHIVVVGDEADHSQ